MHLGISFFFNLVILKQHLIPAKSQQAEWNSLCDVVSPIKFFHKLNGPGWEEACILFWYWKRKFRQIKLITPILCACIWLLLHIRSAYILKMLNCCVKPAVSSSFIYKFLHLPVSFSRNNYEIRLIWHRCFPEQGTENSRQLWLSLSPYWDENDRDVEIWQWWIQILDLPIACCTTDPLCVLPFP